MIGGELFRAVERGGGGPRIIFGERTRHAEQRRHPVRIRLQRIFVAGNRFGRLVAFEEHVAPLGLDIRTGDSDRPLVRVIREKEFSRGSRGA